MLSKLRRYLIGIPICNALLWWSVFAFPASLSRSIWTRGERFRAEDLQFSTRLLRPGDVFVDVGANIGTHTVYVLGVLLLPLAGSIPLNRTLVFSTIWNKMRSLTPCAMYPL